MAMERKAYRFRLYPSHVQCQLMARTFGSVRAMWNMMLADKIKYYEETGKMLYNRPSEYKKQYPWLKEVDSTALSYVQLHLEKAYRDFFKSGFGFPKFKKKKHYQSYSTYNNGGTIRIEGHRVRLPKLGWVRIQQHRPLEGQLKSATVKKTSTGKYYIIILCEVEVAELPKTGSAVGIDLGLSRFANLSDGTVIEQLHLLDKMNDKLKREQRKLSRREKVAKKAGKRLIDSKNYQKQRVKVARIFETMANMKRDFQHKLSMMIVKNHDIICIEDLATSNLMKNHCLAQRISDVAWNSFVIHLSYKAKWYGKTLVKVSRYFPSTQICSHCGHRSSKKPLHIRQWTCENCGTVHDRDLNASQNILKEGLRILAEG